MTRTMRPIAITLQIVFAFIFEIHLSGALQTSQFPTAANKDSVVRFFYQPNPSSYFHVPLLFRVASTADQKWNTAPLSDAGRTAYITASEMDDLLKKLSKLRLSWIFSEGAEPLETYKTIHSFAGMNITVLSSRTTAKASIRPHEICTTLAPLDQILHTPRALWEFQLFRIQYHCRVPNFDPKAYPDRIP